ncbi:unnamed protein product [Cuscuta epithymum]|uniref:WIT1/2 N-terminal helical bundle domain-containing protein n=2 Tax=Cuscuta epithymum TaxID=186058 RepID=A0AAV0E1A9_9ASTE|nr:unnamed protein product [Cuscuta epithymum]
MPIKFTHFPQSPTKDMGEVRSSMEIISQVDMDMAYSSEKLVNLGSLFVTVMTKQDEVEAMAVENDDSPDAVEKALTLHHLSAILKAEFRLLDDFVSNLHGLILGARKKVSSCETLSELDTMVEHKLQDSEESLGQLKERILSMKIQLANPSLIGSLFDQDDWRHDLASKPQVQIAEQKRLLKMLGKSFARELDLEMKMTLMKQNEDDFKMKLKLREHIASCMEEAAEVIWGRFLEADNIGEVLMGISKDMAGQLRIANLNLSGSHQRENEIQLKFLTCMEHSNAKDITIQKLNESIAYLKDENAQVVSLQQNIEKLKQNLMACESQLTRANSSIEVHIEQINEMEIEIESLKEELYQLESRAESAEAKVSQLTETNLEQSEELSFLKDSNDNSVKRVSILETEMRELDIQLQNSKASSEASQEQQNLLYSAIWDMETLIDELKQKVSKAENKTDIAEEQCIALSELNSELNKEIGILRVRLQDMESSLNQAKVEKMASVKDINIKTSFIMDLVTQLTVERERVQKQLCCLIKENRLLMKKLEMVNVPASATILGSREADNKEHPPSTHQFPGDAPLKVPIESSLRISEFNSNKVQDLHEKSSYNETGNGVSSSSTNYHHEEYSVVEEKTVVAIEAKRGQSRRYICIALLISLLSVIAPFLYGRKKTLVDFGS